MAKHYGRRQPARGSKSKTPWALFAMVGALALIIVGVVVLVRPVPTTAGQTNSDTASAGPRVSVDREKLDFGQVKMDTPVRAAFKVRNTGSEPLQILGEPQVRVVEGC